MRRQRIVVLVAVIGMLAAGFAAVPSALAHGRPNTPLTCFFPAVTSNNVDVFNGSTRYGNLYVDLGQDNCNHQVYESYGSFNANGSGGCSTTTIQVATWFGNNLFQQQSFQLANFGPSGSGLCSGGSFISQNYDYGPASGTVVKVCAVLTYFGGSQASVCTTPYTIP